MLLFPDTNFFLQCQAPAEIAWRDVTADDEVRLMVCRTVQGEIDRLKGDGKGRRSDRARKVSAWFASIITGGGPVVLRTATPKVLLDLAPRVGRSHVYPIDLELTRNDDRIVGEVLAYTAESAVLLTDDTGMMATARQDGLAFLPTPDGWRLPPEPDARDRQLADVQKRLTLLERAAPMLELAISSTGAGSPTIGRVRYEPLRVPVIDELLGSMLHRFPEKTDFSLEADPGYAASRRRYPSSLDVGASAGMEWHPPAPATTEAYHAKYAAWQEAVRGHLKGLHSLLPGTQGTTQFTWFLANTGTIPAEGLIVGIEALGELYLAEASAAPSLKERSTTFPVAPTPSCWKPVQKQLGKSGSLRSMLETMVKGHDDSSRDRLQAALPQLPYIPRSPEPRDPQSFYYKNKSVRVLSRLWEFECAEFRHGREPEVFKAVVLAPSKMAGEAGAVRFRASARNIPTALDETTRIRIETKPGNTEEEARLLVTKAHQVPDNS